MVEFDKLMLGSTLVRTSVRGGSGHPSLIGSATGTFFRLDGKEFLVTNRHVVIDEKKGHYPDAAEFLVHTNPADLRSARRAEVPLYGADRRPLWLEHPSAGPRVDLVALDVTAALSPTSDAWGFYAPESFLPQDSVLGLGAPVMVIGYPLGFYDEVFNLPVVRAGTLGSTYGLPFAGAPFFLVDATLHPGTSGSPVVDPAKSWRRTKEGVQTGWFSSSILGVNSGSYGADGVDLELNVVWYAELIPEIVRQKEFTVFPKGMENK